MQPAESIKKVRKYAIAAFIIPLIAINSCLLFYKFVGNLNISKYPNFYYNEQGQSQVYEIKEFEKITNDTKSSSFTNCSKYVYFSLWTTLDGKIIPDGPEPDVQDKLSYEEYIINNIKINNLRNNNQIKSVTRIYTTNLNNECVKNHHFLYTLFSKFSFLEKIVLVSLEKNITGYAKVNNPYLYGEVSISRTARYFPATFIFKPLIILSAFFLFIYWKNNLNLFRELKNKNILVNVTKKFFYFGLFSCIFLTFHALFLGLDIDSKLFANIRRLIIILFILSEVIAQILLTKNLFNFREKLKEYISPLILKTKVAFVVIVFIITCVAFLILAFGDPSTAFKHTLEWNYFAFLLFYYLLSWLLWKAPKNQKF